MNVIKSGGVIKKLGSNRKFCRKLKIYKQDEQNKPPSKNECSSNNCWKIKKYYNSIANVARQFYSCRGYQSQSKKESRPYGGMIKYKFQVILRYSQKFNRCVIYQHHTKENGNKVSNKPVHLTVYPLRGYTVGDFSVPEIQNKKKIRKFREYRKDFCEIRKSRLF